MTVKTDARKKKGGGVNSLVYTEIVPRSYQCLEKNIFISYISPLLFITLCLFPRNIIISTLSSRGLFSDDDSDHL